MIVTGRSINEKTEREWKALSIDTKKAGYHGRCRGVLTCFMRTIFRYLRTSQLLVAEFCRYEFNVVEEGLS